LNGKVPKKNFKPADAQDASCFAVTRQRNAILWGERFGMKLFWKLFCSMVCVTVLACSLGGFVLIDGQFRTALNQEVQALYEENDMLRCALSMEAEGRVLSGREELARLTQGVTLATVGRAAAFRLSDETGAELGGNNALPPDLNTFPLTSELSENQWGWRLANVARGAYFLHGASALTLLDETVYLENCRDVSALFAQRSAQYRSFFYMMLALIAGVGALSFVVSHLILRPLNRLSAAARGMADGELGQQVPVRSDDELGRLSADFNAMARRIEAQVKELTDAARREKDFTGSFAHDALLYSALLGKKVSEVSEAYKGTRTLYEGGQDFVVVLEDIGVMYLGAAETDTLNGERTVEQVLVLQDSFQGGGVVCTDILELREYFGAEDYAGNASVTLLEAVAVGRVASRGTGIGFRREVEMEVTSEYEDYYQVEGYDEDYTVYLYSFRKDGLIYHFVCQNKEEGFSFYTIEQMGEEAS